MKRKCVMILLVFSVSAFGWKKEAHFISLPFIEGAGLYSSIMVLEESSATSSKVPAAATVTLLVANAAVGAATAFGPQDWYPAMRTMHRFMGYGITVAALWMSIAAANDKNVKNPERNVSYVYTALSTVPIIMFSF